jgi:hypothetical protein
VEFRSADGDGLERKVATVTNAIGEYTVLLEPGLAYAVTVAARGFCPAHRPSFRLTQGSAVSFDFTLTIQCPGDLTVVEDPGVVGALDKESSDDAYFAYFASGIPYYFEEDIARAESRRAGNLIIAFGTRRKGHDRVEYASLPIKGHPETRLPVSISFGTYTVRADKAVLDRKSWVLTAEGNVSVEDGSNSPPVASSCLTLQLADSELRPQPCRDMRTCPSPLIACNPDR